MALNRQCTFVVEYVVDYHSSTRNCLFCVVLPSYMYPSTFFIPASSSYSTPPPSVPPGPPPPPAGAPPPPAPPGGGPGTYVQIQAYIYTCSFHTNAQRPIVC